MKRTPTDDFLLVFSLCDFTRKIKVVHE